MILSFEDVTVSKEVGNNVKMSGFNIGKGLSKAGSQKCLALDSLTYNFTKTKVFSSVSSLPSLPVSEDASYYIPEETYCKKYGSFE